MLNKDQGKPEKKLETDEPLSEKDEVKKAEHRMAKAQKDIKEGTKTGLKSSEKHE